MLPVMVADPAPLDLSVPPPEYRVAFEGLIARTSELEELANRQEALIAELHNALYGKKSERLTEDERQLAFEDLEVAVSEVAETRDTLTAAPAPTEKKRPPKTRDLGNLPSHPPRIEEVVEPDSLDCPCDRGQMHRIGEDRAERLDVVPAQFRVVVTIRPRYACRACTDGVRQAPAPAHLIEGALPTEALIAMCWSANTPITCPCTGSRRSWPGPASICIARRWRIGWERRRSISPRWSTDWPRS